MLVFHSRTPWPSLLYRTPYEYAFQATYGTWGGGGGLRTVCREFHGMYSMLTNPFFIPCFSLRCLFFSTFLASFLPF